MGTTLRQQLIKNTYHTYVTKFKLQHKKESTSNQIYFSYTNSSTQYVVGNGIGFEVSLGNKDGNAVTFGYTKIDAFIYYKSKCIYKKTYNFQDYTYKTTSIILIDTTEPSRKESYSYRLLEEGIYDVVLIFTTKYKTFVKEVIDNLMTGSYNKVIISDLETTKTSSSSGNKSSPVTYTCKCLYSIDKVPSNTTINLSQFTEE